MSSPPIYTAITLPTVTSYPSAKCLQWSADGQLCFATKTAAYIMTPDHGITFDLVSTIKSTPPAVAKDGARAADEGEIPAVGWFKTMIQFDKSDVQRWPEYSQAWGSASLGSIDVALWDVAFSPSGLSSDSGCVLAALTSNMDLTLWTASKNCLKGEWIKVMDVTPFLLEAFSASNNTMKDTAMTARVLKSQITSMTWTQPADFGFTPPPPVDGSLLVVGSRAGELTFLRYRPNQTVSHLETVSVTDKWITRICVSVWKAVAPGICEACLAYATADGSIGLVKLSQTLQVTHSSGSRDEIALEVDPTVRRAREADRAGILALEWIEIPDKGPVLFYAKPGILFLFSPPNPSIPWSRNHARALRLQTMKLSAGSSSFHPPCGVSYIHRRDMLVVALFDGSCHVVHNVSTDPSLTPPAEHEGNPPTSKSLSVAVRNAWIRSETESLGFCDVNRITGMASYDGGATFVWVQEASRPSDFSYKHDAKHSSMLFVARTWDDTEDEAFMSELGRVINGARTVMGTAPLHILRPFFFWLGDRKRLVRLRGQLLDMLRPPAEDPSVHVSAPRFDVLSPEARGAFRASLAQHLFGWDVLLSLRLRLALADFAAQKNAEDAGMQEEFATVAQSLLTMISHRVLRMIIRHLTAAVNVLTLNDVPFVLRMVVQSLLGGSPPDLSEEGTYLSKITQATVLPSQQSEPGPNTFNERCPACDVEVPLQDITTAVCSNGHTWARCSITTFILSTPLVRTCIGCRRKAFLPLSTANTPERNWLPGAAQGWVVEELLEAVHRCLFCNNSFINVL